LLKTLRCDLGRRINIVDTTLTSAEKSGTQWLTVVLLIDA
jgi:hypothetical protein